MNQLEDVFQFFYFYFFLNLLFCFYRACKVREVTELLVRSYKKPKQVFRVLFNNHLHLDELSLSYVDNREDGQDGHFTFIGHSL
jgi:hypothetical protein